MNQSQFKCLRCNHVYEDTYIKEQEPRERSCPQCKSNSIRRMKDDR